MKKIRTVLLLLLAASLMFTTVGCTQNNKPASEQEGPQTGEYPSKPIELVVPFGAGGSIDMHSRAVVAVVSQYLGGPMIVSLKPGGSGAIGSEYVASSKPDGYTLLFGSSGPNTALHHVRELPYEREDFIPIAKINHSPNLFVVREDSPFQTMEDLIEYARQNPGKVTYSSSGPFGSNHIPAEMFAEAAGLDLVHVPFDGGGPSLMAALGGQVDFGSTMPTQARPLVEAGKMRALAFMDTERDKGNLKDAPTLIELGYDCTFAMWRTVLAPKDTPEEVVTQLREAFKQLAEDPTFIKMIEQMGEEVMYKDGPDFQKEWDAEFAAQEPTLKRLAAEENK